MVEETSVSDVAHKNLSIYGKAMAFAAFPNAVDGLKPIHRRILVSIRDLRGEFSSNKLIAATSELHPYGDASIYDTAVRMSQEFEYNPAMITFESAGGTYSDPRAAGRRYTSEKLADFSYDIFFKGVEFKSLPKMTDENLDGYEPVFLAPAIPTALLYANNTIGFGESSYSAPHNLADVCDLVIAFCNHQKKSPILPFDYTLHVQKFLPDFPVVGILTNHRQLLEAYRKGEFKKKIHLDGEVVVSSDMISIRTLPYGTPFKSLVSQIEALMLDKNSWYDRNIHWVKSLSEKYNVLVGDVCIKLKRGVNVFEAWELIRKKISFSGTMTPITNYNYDGNVTDISQPNLLHAWYSARYNILVSSKKIKITKLTDDLRRVEARLIVCDHIDDVVAIIRSGADTNAVAIELHEKYNLTLFQANYIIDTPLSILIKTSKIEYERRRVELEKALKVLRDSFGRIPDEMAAEAIALKNKYSTPRRTRIPSYIGYVKISGGCIQFDSVDEIPGIIEAFPKGDLEIYMYDGPYIYKVTESGKLETGYVPKVTMGDIYGLVGDPETHLTEKVYTVNFADDAACCVEGFVPGLRVEGYSYTTRMSNVISRNGTIRTVDVTEEFSMRKTICRGSATDVIYVYPQPKDNHYVIALNTSTPNVIAIQRVTPNKSKIAMNPAGVPRVVHSMNNHFFLNLPAEFTNRNNYRVIEFLSLEDLLDGKNQIQLYLGSTSTKTNKHIRLL